MFLSRFYIVVMVLLCGHIAVAQQLKLGANPYVLNKSAVLELSSDNQGLLLPRITDTAMINPLNPPDGMIIYFTPSKQFLLRANGYWNALASATSLNDYWSTSGNSNNIIKRLGNIDNFDLPFVTNNIERLRILSSGNIGIGVTAPTATLHLKAGTTAAGSAPLKLTSGALMTTGEAGAIEFLTDKYYGTITSSNSRKEFTLNDAALTTSRLPVATTNGRLTNASNLYYSNTRFGVYQSTPTAFLHLGAGLTTASNAPLKFTTGSLLTALENGAVEYDGVHLYITIGGVRYQLDQQPGTTYTASNGITLSGTNFRNNLITGIAGGQTVVGGTDAANALTLSSTTNATKGKLLFGTSGYDEANNRLGIGNSAPTEVLDVTGNVKFSGALMPNNDAGTSGYVLQSNGTGSSPSWLDLNTSVSNAMTATAWLQNGNNISALKNFGTTSNHALPFITNNIERMRLTTNGYLGIGTTAPSSLLHLSGINPLTLNGVQNGGTTTSDSVLTINNGLVQKLPVSTFSSSASSWSVTGNNGLNSGTNFWGTTDNVSLRIRTNNLERMVVDSNGNIGIAKAAPTERLDITGNLRLSGAFMPGGSAGTAGYVLQSNGAGSAPTWIDGTAYINSSTWLQGGSSVTSLRNLGTTTNYALPFVTNNIERMRLTTAGFLGIGTSSPSTSLHVVGTNPLTLTGVQTGTNTSADSLLTINSGLVQKLPVSTFATTSNSWSTTGNSGTAWSSNFLGTSDNGSIRFRTNNTQRMVIDSLGRIGIGVTNPSALLVVKDTMEIRRTGSLSTLLFTNTAVSGDFRIAGDGGDIFWQGGGGRSLQMGSYWGMVLSGDRQTTSFPAFSAGTGGIGVLVPASRTGSIPLVVQGMASQTANLSEWRNSANTSLAAITSAGNLGIGTASPSTRLHVVGTNPLTLNGVQLGGTTTADSVLTINNGTVQKLPMASFTTSSSTWNVSGNSGISSSSFLGSTNNASVRFRTNNTERLIIDSLGKVGIGTSAPAQTLDINGDVGVQSTLYIDKGNTNAGGHTPGLAFGGTSSGETIASRRTSGANQYGLDFYTSYNRRMSITNSGNVGIGTTTFDGTSPERLKIDAGTGTYTPLLATGNYNGYFQINVKNNSTGTSSSSDLVATADNGTETTNFINLGINGSNFTYSAGSPIETGKANDGYLISSGQDLYIVNNNPSKSIMFLAGGTAAVNEAMRITAAEDVGIGTTAPSDRLHVVKATGSGATTANIMTVETVNTSTSSTSNPPNLTLVRQIPSFASNTTYAGPLLTYGYRTSGTVNNLVQLQALSYPATSRLSFYTRTGMTNSNPATGTLAENMWIDGTTLAVRNLIGSSTAGLSADANGNIIRTPSDARLKTNVSTISSPLEKIKKMRGVTYNWLDTARFGHRKEMGFIAQELEQVVPEVVTEGGEYKSVNYQVLNALLTEAVKEQQKQIEDLKKDLQDLKSELLEIKKAIQVEQKAGDKVVKEKP